MWWNVLVEPEKVGRVVARLDRCQPIPGRAGIRLAYTVRAIFTKEIDVCPGITLTQPGRKVGHPGLVRRCLVRLGIVPLVPAWRALAQIRASEWERLDD